MAEREYLGGVTNTTLHFEDGKMTIEEVVDAEPILDFAAAARNGRFDANVCDGMMRHEAEIPWPIFLEECRKRNLPASVFGSAQGDLILEQIVRDPQYAKFRTAPVQRDPRIVMKGAR